MQRVSPRVTATTKDYCRYITGLALLLQGAVTVAGGGLTQRIVNVAVSIRVSL